MSTVTAEEIDALLPQTQCGECGYKGCRPYAEAIAYGNESIELCPPGGVATLKALAELLAIDPTPYLDQAAKNTRRPAIAQIREAECIGCTKCIQACPVDAIIGAAKQMHTIITQECTGCDLCIEPCPVDCIDLITIEQSQFDKQKSRERFNARQLRLQQRQTERRQKQQQATRLSQTESQEEEKAAKKAYIEEALARVKAKRSSSKD